MIDRVRELLSGRRQSYARVFAGEGKPGDAEIVLEDLMNFCRFGQSAFNPDQRATDVLLGRQEVIHRIMDFAKLDIETLYAKYHGKKSPPRTTGENDGG